MDRLSLSLQENILLVACFDEHYGPLVRNLISADLLEGEYGQVIRRVYDYIDKHQTVPGAHTPDLFDDILEGDDDTKAKLYARVLQDLVENQEGLNGEYIISKAEDFVRRQSLKDGIVRAAEEIQNRNDLDRAEEILQDAMARRLTAFNPGISLLDFDSSLSFLNQEEVSFPVGIPDLDFRGLGPARKELHLYIGLPKSGKTWWFVNMGKRNVMLRNKVLHITLEMSETKMAQRYYQALFAVSKRKEKISITHFVKDELDRLTDLREMELLPKLSFDDPEIAQKLMKATSAFGLKFGNLIIKQFPTGGLTVRELQGYLDLLEMRNNFIPDIVIVDYADLMSVDPAHYRQALGAVYKDLRGLAVSRNIAIATASQSNRAGADKKQIEASNVSEDWSKIATVDCAITYNQTAAEKKLNLARLFVAAGRNDADKFSVLLSQNYAIGQYVLDSAMMLSNYWELVGQDSANE